MIAVFRRAVSSPGEEAAGADVPGARCLRFRLGVFFATAAGETFALNPAAIRMAGRVGAAADLDPIWRWTDRDLPNVKVNVSPIILYALALC